MDIDPIIETTIDTASDSSAEVSLLQYRPPTMFTFTSTAKDDDVVWTSDEFGSSASASDESDDGSEGPDIPYYSGDVASDVERVRREPIEYKAKQVAAAQRQVDMAMAALKAAKALAGEGDLSFTSFKIVSCSDFAYVSTASDDEPAVTTKAPSPIPFHRFTHSALPTMKRKSESQPRSRLSKKPKAKAIFSSDSEPHIVQPRRLASQGESEVEDDSDEVEVVAPKGKGKAKAKKTKAKSDDVKEKPIPKHLGPYDPTIHTKYEDRCKLCSSRSDTDFCYYITATLAKTRKYYLARRNGDFPFNDRPKQSSCVRCIPTRKGTCISPPNRSIVGPDFIPGHAYTPNAPMVKSYFLHKFFGRDEDGNPLPGFPHDLTAIKAASRRAYPETDDVTKPEEKAGGRRSTVRVEAKAKKLLVVEITAKAPRRSLRATVEPEFVAGSSSAQAMEIDEVAAATGEEGDAEVIAE